MLPDFLSLDGADTTSPHIVAGTIRFADRSDDARLPVLEQAKAWLQAEYGPGAFEFTVHDSLLSARFTYCFAIQA